MLALGAQLLGAFLKLVGPGDLGEEVALAEGHTVRRWPEQRVRRLLTVFGEFLISRCVYGTRPGQKIDLVPTDQRLQLPEGDTSYLLQEWDQLLGTEQAFGLVRDTLETVLGFRQSVDTLERGNRQMAEAAPAFRESQPAPKPEDEGVLLVVTEDNKGVPMVRSVEAVPAGCHRKKGEKANKKQMGMHRLRVYGRSSCPHARRDGCHILSRPGSTAAEAARSPAKALLDRADPRGRRMHRACPGRGLPALARRCGFAPAAGSDDGPLVRWPTFAGDRSPQIPPP